MICAAITVPARLNAFHTDTRRDEGRHAHCWRIRAIFARPDAGADSRDFEALVAQVLEPLQGQDLPPALFAAEDLAIYILARLIRDGCERISVDRDAEGFSGAEAWRS